ncbi:MAG: hypothetical protein IME93_06250 [Proteobacteria bacterium]|nr:hypothetical protein [Pseudomonadota bacterium]
MRSLIIVLCSLLWSITLMAAEVEIVDAKAKKSGSSWQFDVTLRHGDTGWKHYANKWEVLSLNGKVLGTRVLYHPHVEEQPFTRSLSGVDIPQGTKEVLIRAYDSKHGKSSKDYKLQLPN